MFIYALFMIILSWLTGTVATVPVPVSHDLHVNKAVLQGCNTC